MSLGSSEGGFIDAFPDSVARAYALAMIRRLFILTLATVLVSIVANGPFVRSGRAQTPAPPGLRVSSANPHYLEYRGRPLLLISSAEHYGAVINQDFDFMPYLAALHRDGLNQTRLWTGFYVEDPQAFNFLITNNTLAPATGRYIAPWARSDQPGYANGGNKFDLSRWDDAFFARLRNYLIEAERRGVIVEIVLFCPFYQDSMWEFSPLNPRNNVNGVGAGLTRQSVYVLDRLEPAVVSFMDTYVRKIVTEVNRFDNLYFELVNEPYSLNDIVPDQFQRHVADLIVATERTLPKRHLIAQNIANGSGKIENPHPAVSIFNFHYASPPDAVTTNYGLGKIIGDDETGFRGQADLPYRIEAWNFIVAGGGIFSHLDYSYTTAHPAGTWMPLPPNQPGGGGPEFRRQMRVLAEFMNGFEFVRMTPRADVVSIVEVTDLTARALVEEGRQYAIYVSFADTGRGRGVDPLRERATATLPERSVGVAVTLPAGRYDATWVSPLTGQPALRESITHAGGTHTLRSPAFTADLALKIVRVGG
jgi:hypothetical protein